MLKPAPLLSSVFLFLIMGLMPLRAQQVVINEFLASNSSVSMDPDFDTYADWIELFNPGDDSIDLGGFFLTDDLNDPGKWQFPERVWLPPGGFILVWADGRASVMSAYHAGFKLSMGGEEIGLLDTSGTLIDSVVYGQQMEDISLGRQPDGDAQWHYFGVPSPGLPNNQSIYLKTKNPAFSLPAGFYTGSQELLISVDDTGAVIRFTTNGDEPTESSPVYTGALPITSREGDPNLFSEIRTNEDPFHWLPDWIPPAGEVFKGNVIRARAFRDGYDPSDIITSTYFVDEAINERYPTISVISINSDTRHLFNEKTGIYVPGIYHVSGDNYSGNYFQDWEKPAHMEFFEPGGQLGFAQDVGIRIQGGSSPASPQKGLHVIARAEYGESRISYPLFADDPSSANELTEFKRFIIRAWGSLITGSLFNDAYAHRLMARNDLDIQAYRPVVVFINGEYWGLHALREANKNSWYYQYHHDINRDDPGYDILLHTERNGAPYADVDEGDASHWQAMLNYINTHDMKQEEHYNHLKTLMDMDNFITYMGHCIYVGKWDWPNNNDASWRPRTSDGRWRWIQFDMETGFGVATGLGPEYRMLGPQLNMFTAAIEGLEIPNFGTYGPHPILSEIYTNQEFMEDFVDWFLYRFDHEFHPDTMNMILDEMAGELRPYMEEYHERWPFIANVRGAWETSLEGIREFNDQRQEYVKEQLLMLSGTEKITPQNYRLLQNYPNPFRSSTTIRYMIPEPGEVIIRVFNTLGEEVERYSEQHLSGGHFSYHFDAVTRAGGVYLYTFECGGHFEVKKMLLVK